ncbi:hypothetical protein [Calothrix sp. UHCC 0171]|nr:hypothetical protein [Calothrix sp. UHCC 0171]MEA5574096.1 hypothetical protein [Calothrix sp. UHCC 0171]
MLDRITSEKVGRTWFGQQAIAAGAISLMEPNDEFWGEAIARFYLVIT